MAIVVGIESTAHTFGVGIVKNGKVIANERDMYTTKSGGIIPVDSAEHHREVSKLIYKKAIKSAKINEKEIDTIAYSRGPGLSPCLLAGRDFAVNLAKRLNLSLVPVNHCVAHLEIGRITGANNPVLLYCSGANTQVISYAAGKYRVFGETLDVGVGNFIDNFARYSNLGFPGGPKIEKIATKSNILIDLPYSVKGMDISLSGILTNLRQKLEKGEKLSNLSYSLQETVFAMLIETAERALAHVNKDELLLGGGVSCNSRLQEMAENMCLERGSKFFCPEKMLLVDNGAMIAYLGEIMFNSGIKVSNDDSKELDIRPRERTDEVNVTWKD